MEHKNIVDHINELYLGKTVQLFFGTSGGNQIYCDSNKNSNTYVEGEVLWGKDDTVALRCTIDKGQSTYTRDILFNGWQIVFCLPSEGSVHVGHVLKETYS